MQDFDVLGLEFSDADLDEESGHAIAITICKAIDDDEILTRIAEGDVSVARHLEICADEANAIWEMHNGPYSEALETLATLLDSIAREVESLMRDGVREEAARRLNLVLRPKWDSLATCDAAYGVATGRVYGPPDRRCELDKRHAELASLPMFAPPCHPRT